MSEEMVLKPQQKSPTADHSAQPTPPVLTGQPETSSESDAEEEEEQGGYELLPQSEEDESGHDQEREEEEVEVGATSASLSRPPVAARPVLVASQEPSKALLDEGQVGVIKQAMAGFSLPPAAAPEWAKEVPEEVWKERLLTQLRAARTGDKTQHLPGNELKDVSTTMQ